MSLDAWIAVGVTAYVLITLAIFNAPADLVFASGLTILVLPIIPGPDGWHGVLSVNESVRELGNPSVVTIGVLFVVVAGLRETGGLTWIVEKLLGKPTTIFLAQWRMMVPLAAVSAFMNNTPLVAIMIPIVKEWSQRIRISPSKLMIPLSFASIYGGICSLIGTSTNLTVYGLMQSVEPEPILMGFFDIAWVGVPCAIIGVTFIALTSRWLLPDRKSALSSLEDPREYTIEMIIESGSSLVGATVESAGLRHLAGVYLVEIERAGELVPNVGPKTRLASSDRLVFVGVVDSIKDLKRIRGLVPATDQVFKIGADQFRRCLFEAVVSDTYPNLGKTIRDGRFRNNYDAAVIAVARNGERIKSKIGDIVLQPGDTLLLEAHPDFIDRHRNRKDFFLVSQVQGSTPVRHERSWISMAILATMVLLMSTQVVDVLVAAMIAAGLMVLTRCCTAAEARSSVDWSLLVVIACSLAMASALSKTKAADTFASVILGAVQGNPHLSLASIYLVTMIFSELLSNNAAAALAFPVALATARELDANPMSFIVAVMIAASCSFATPIGYQTNLMVYGPGGYRFLDYTKIGVPLDLITLVVVVTLAPLVWPF